MFSNIRKKITRWQAGRSMPFFPITRDLNKFRFGFFGEFAFSLSSWLPYLLFLKGEGHSPIKTIGPCGSKPYYYFSDDHMELPIDPGPCWGTAENIVNVQNLIDEHLISPCNERDRHLEIYGHKWQNTETHRNLKSENYCKLSYSTKSTLVPDLLLPYLSLPYHVVNVKTYFNHNNNSIKTFYDENDLLEIAKFCKMKGHFLILNRFPNTEKFGNMFVDDSMILTEAVTNQQHVFDMRNVYSTLNSLSDCNLLQIKILKEAEHVFATNGGNAFLSMILAKQVSFMMQGGGDFAEFNFLSMVYNKNFKIAYTTRDLISLMEIDS